MSGEIVKAWFLCKTTMSEAPRHGGGWSPVFVEGKTYEGEYETWSWKDGYKCNGGWRRYWVVREDGEKQEMNRAHFRAVFHADDISEMRNNKIEEILKKEI